MKDKKSVVNRIKSMLGVPQNQESKSHTVSESHDLLELPFLFTTQGTVQAALKIDDIWLDKGWLTLQGWSSSIDGTFTIDLMQGRLVLSCVISSVLRPDVVESMAKHNVDLKSQGFKLRVKLTEASTNEIVLQWRIKAASQSFRFGLAIPSLKLGYVGYADQPNKNNQLISKKVSGPFGEAIWIKPDLLKANGHIDRFGVIPNRCGLLAGWVITQSGWEIWLVDENGNAEAIETALRYQRPDVVSEYRNKFSQHTVDAGFMMQWPHPMRSDNYIFILAYHPISKQAFEIFKLAPEEVSEDPEGYVRWAFSVPTPTEKFDERLNRWEGKFIATLLAERQAWFEKHSKPPEVQVLGRSLEAPAISLVIPLYARWDFVEHQLLAFVQDRRLLETTEIIFVVDDPEILTAVSNEVENLYRMYEVPFKVIWGHRNRGFSGANNLGVSISRGRQVLLLNSDAFPTRPGWANRLGDLLDANPEYGLLGARLLNPEGGMQHAGMEFIYSSSWRVWLNKHPLAGLAPELDVVPHGVEIVEKPAVTGACMILTRRLFEELGGLDEGYLIGDFEDSDLCLKVFNRGLLIGYVPGVELVHLERQSFSTLGDISFRSLVVRFNAWRHTQRWGTQIELIMKTFS